jgi:hypothetical protein
MLKKIAIAAVLTLTASTSFAGTFGTITDLKGYNPSKGVTGSYTGAKVNTTSPGNDVYAIGTKHAQGDNNYGTTSASSSIWVQSVAVTANVTAPSTPGTTTDSAVQSGWSSM